MKTFLKQLKFPSTDHTYLKDITPDVRESIEKAKVDSGFIFVNSHHTTLGIVINEIAEPNLLNDILDHTLHHVPEDRRSTRVAGKKAYHHPTTDYTHRCQDNPFCDEQDEDYNAASHIRALLFSHPSVVVPVMDGKLQLGKYQQIAIFEFDGRDGTGKNPIRQRTVQIWIHPTDGIEELD